MNYSTTLVGFILNKNKLLRLDKPILFYLNFNKPFTRRRRGCLGRVFEVRIYPFLKTGKPGAEEVGKFIADDIIREKIDEHSIKQFEGSSGSGILVFFSRCL